jgi:hypothetical protein
VHWREAGLAVLLLAAACGSDARDERPAATCRPAPLRTTDEYLDVQDLVQPSPDGAVDTDGDGTADRVIVDQRGVEVTRGDGTLLFAGAELRTSGDLDGDRRDDLVLHLADHDVAVAGTTAPGDHDPDKVGVRLGPRLNYVWPDDLDGRPGADFAAPQRDAERSRTTVWSGAAVLARGPGGDARDLRPARTYVGLTRAVASLTPGGRPETILLVPGAHTSLRFARRPLVELRTSWSGSRVENVKVFDESDGRRIALVVDRHVAVWAAPPTCR